MCISTSGPVRPAQFGNSCYVGKTATATELNAISKF
jgi:hypothetical protein